MSSANGANLIDFVFLETGSVAPKNFPTYQWHLRCGQRHPRLSNPASLYNVPDYALADRGHYKIKMVELLIGCWADSKVG